MRLSNIFEQLEDQKKSNDLLIESLRKRYLALQTLNESTLEYDYEMETLKSDIFEAAMNTSSFEESIAFVNRIDEGMLSSIAKGIGNGIKGLFNMLKDAWNSLKGPIKNFLDTIDGSYEKYLDVGNLYESQILEDSFDDLFEALTNVIPIDNVSDLKEYLFGTKHPIYSTIDPALKMNTLDVTLAKSVRSAIFYNPKQVYSFLTSLDGKELKIFVDGIPHIYTSTKGQEFIGLTSLTEYVSKYPGKELPTDPSVKNLTTLKVFLPTVNSKTSTPAPTDDPTEEPVIDDSNSATRKKALTVVIKKIISDKKFSAVYEKTGTSKKDVWVSKGGFYDRLKLNDFKLVKTIIGMKNKGTTPNAAYVTFFAFVPVLWEEFMQTAYAKADTNFYNYLKFNMTAVRKLESHLSTTELALDGFGKEFVPELQSDSKYASLTNDKSLVNTLGTDAFSKPKVKAQIMEALKKYNKNDFEKNLAMLQVLEKAKIQFMTFNSKISAFKVQSTLKDNDVIDSFINQLLQDDAKLSKFVTLTAFPKYDKAIYPKTEDYIVAVISLL